MCQMAFQPPSSGPPGPERQNQNRKILEQLEEQKKRLRMQTHGPQAVGNNSAPPANTGLPPSAVAAPVQHMPIPSVGIDNHHMTPAQRAALQHAHANSVGFFITQDSSFGNLILPVLPRFEK